MTTAGEKWGSPRTIFIKTGKAHDRIVQTQIASVQKADVSTSADGEITSNAVEALQGSKAWITPTYDFEVLERRVRVSSILPPLIDAMEANIDGTGWELVPIDPEDEKDSDEMKKERKRVAAFFEECWPGESFVTVRKKIRRNYEEVGNAYLEVIRNAAGKIVFARWLDAKGIRAVRLDDPVDVEKTIERNGEKLTVKVEMRERRFIQIPRASRVGDAKLENPSQVSGPKETVYFKEFGSTRDLNKRTGDWAPLGERLPKDERATEIIWFTNKPDSSTPYGIPRWISNTPSVVGAREAEEFNLDFFNSGGVPPLLLIVSGGRMAEEAEKVLTKHFMSSGPNRHNAAIMEAYATGGDIDSPQNVKVQVERFGSERQNDSMFEAYIEKCENRIRRSFRLPPIFLGTADRMSFATAFASYTVAEAQVFGPERDEFDEKINLLIMPELSKKLKYRTLPLPVRDVSQQLKGLEMVADKVTGESFVEAVSQITDLTVRTKDGLEQLDEVILIPGMGVDDKGVAIGQDGKPIQGNPDQATRQKPVGGAGGQGKNRKGLPRGSEPVRTDAKKTHGLAALAEDAIKALLHRDAAALRDARSRVASLPALDHHTFTAILAASLFPEMSHDPEGARELAGCTFAILAANAEE